MNWLDSLPCKKKTFIFPFLATLSIVFMLVSCSRGNDDETTPLPAKDPNAVRQITHKKIAGHSMDIYVPKNYDETKEYPVIYFNDGQALFQGGDFEMELILNYLIEYGFIEEVIMVGIYAGPNRTENYVPYVDSRLTENPNGLGYTEDLVNHIIPWVDENFSTIANATGRSIMGYSLGGLHATWAGINYPEYFSKVAALSPVYWAGNWAIFREQPSANPNLRIWFDIGTEEFIPLSEFQRLLISQGIRYGRDAFYYEVDGGIHDIFAWRLRVHFPLLAFHGINQDFTPEGMEVITEVFRHRLGGPLYTRINPIVTTTNGIKYSLGDAARYTVENPEAGTVSSDGTFTLFGDEDLRVKIQFQHLRLTHTIEYRDVKTRSGN